MRITRDHSLLLLIDLQTRLAPHILDHEAIIARSQALLDAAEIFGIPKRMTEHCPHRIGPAIEPLRRRFAATEIYEKSSFGAADEAPFVDLLRATGRRQAIVAGMEAHVCVLQTALGLHQHGFEVAIVADAVGSRRSAQRDRDWALQRLVQEGCRLAGAETVLYEWTATAADPRLREVLAIVKRS